MASRFFRYQLRTTDPEAARAFYKEILGAPLREPEFGIVPLPERAAAQGAPAHWLGYIGVSDPAETAARAVLAGGQQLGPVQPAPDGSLCSILRDPFGAILALSSGSADARPGASGTQQVSVAWHVHHSQDHERSFAWYAALFGWTATETLELGPQNGSRQNFAWDPSGRSVGSMTNLAREPHIHPQWLFFFRVPDLENSLARVRALGGLTLEARQTWSGALVAPCDDPQGAAFALWSHPGEP
jgi:hypothetical protein